MTDKNIKPIVPAVPKDVNPIGTITTGRITVAPANLKPPKTK
ncbi:hypothetical protein [Chryseobacterium caseinilyticum]|nr:hypothetical protein [Chryseobacterium caseinilyticum]